MPSSFTRTVAVAAALAAFATGHALAQQVVDPHAVYEKGCYGCHTEHAADLARQRLAVKADKLVVTRTGKELSAILRNHHGVKLKADELAAVSQLFRNGIAWGGIYQHRCAGCHDKAVTLARTGLKMDGERVVVTKTGADIRDLLKSHGGAQGGSPGGATASEIDILVAMLKYQLATAPKP